GSLLAHFEHIFFFSSRRRHTRSYGDWSSDVCSSDLASRRLVPRRAPLAKARVRVRVPPDEPLVREHAPRGQSNGLTGDHMVTYVLFRWTTCSRRWPTLAVASSSIGSSAATDRR